MGGVVSYELARRYPGVAAGIVLLHPMPLRHSEATRALFGVLSDHLNHPKTERSARESIMDGAMFTDSTDPLLRQRLKTLMLGVPAEVAGARWSSLATYGSIVGGGTAVQVPALLISGRRAANDDRVLRELLPGIVTHTLDVGSFVQLEEPERTNELIEEFVADRFG